MADAELLDVAGVGHKFRAALELLIVAHLDELQGNGTVNSTGLKFDLPVLHESSSNREGQYVINYDAQHTESSTRAPPQRVTPRTQFEDMQHMSTLSNQASEDTQEDAQESETMPTNANDSSETEEAGTRGSLRSTIHAHFNKNRCGGTVDNSPTEMFNMRKKLESKVAIDEQEYGVAQYYYESGTAQAIASSEIFGNITLAVIATNAVYMGIDADYNKASNLNDSDLVFILCEQFFAAFFTFELLVRFCAFQRKLNCLRDGWFKFDSILVSIIWLETYIMPLLVWQADVDLSGLPTGPVRLLRLLRLARLARLLRSFPELVTMIKGMFVATRAVGSAMLLLIVAIYGWGIAMHSFMKDDEAVSEYWGTVTRSMMTLLANGTLGDSIGTVMRGVDNNKMALAAFICFVIFAMLTVLNMLVGVLCEVVTEVAHFERDNVTLTRLKSSLLVMLKRLDADGSGDISKEEFTALFLDAEAQAVMDELNIDIDHFVDIMDMQFALSDDDEVKIVQIMHLLIEGQGDRPTTVSDLAAESTFTRWSLKSAFAAAESGRSVLLQEIKAVRNLLSRDIQRPGTPSAMLQDLSLIRGEVDSIKKSTRDLAYLHSQWEHSRGDLLLVANV